MRNRRKKAQLQMGENVIILVVFFFLLIIAVVFFANLQQSKIVAKTREFQSRDILDLTTLISSLPELACSQNNDITENCVDMINMILMQDLWNSVKSDTTSVVRDYYKYKFGNSNITIKKLNPIDGVWETAWTVYSEGNSSTYRIVRIPISLYNATSSDYDFGILELKVFT